MDHRRGVDQNHVKLSAEPFQKRRHARRIEKIRWGDTATSTRKQVKPGTFGFTNQVGHRNIFQMTITAQDVAQAPVIADAKHAIESRAAQITFDEQNLAADLCNRNTQVAGDSGFAITRSRTGNPANLRTLAIFDGQQNRSQRGSGAFGQHRWLALPGSELRAIRLPRRERRSRASGVQTARDLTGKY